MLGDRPQAARPAVQLVVVSGELAIDTVEQLDRVLDQAIADVEEGVVVDLEDATFLDSRAIYSLMRAAGELRRRLARLAIVCSNARMRRLFVLTSVDRAITIHATRADAVRIRG